MPYIVKRSGKGWKVAKSDDPSVEFSKKPHKTKVQAVKQMRAIILSEHAHKHGVQGGILPFFITII